MLIANLPKDKHYKYFQAAYIAAISSSGAGRDDFRHGCVISNKKNILVAKYNIQKTHPKCLLFSKWPWLHAESNAIISLGLDRCYSNVLYVLRIMKNDHIALSKPCKSCEKLIEFVGIKHVFYTTYDGYEKL